MKQNEIVARNAAMREAADAGKSIAAIADEFGLGTAQTIAILRRRSDSPYRRSRLPDDIVVAARESYRGGKETIDEIAKRLGMLQQNAAAMIRGISYKHLPGMVPEPTTEQIELIKSRFRDRSQYMHYKKFANSWPSEVFSKGDFQTRCRALFGKRWRTKLAAGLGLTTRAIESAEERDTIPKAWRRLVEALEAAGIRPDRLPPAYHLD